MEINQWETPTPLTMLVGMGNAAEAPVAAAAAGDSTGNSEEGGHVGIQIEMGSEYHVGTRQAATAGY